MGISRISSIGRGVPSPSGRVVFVPPLKTLVDAVSDQLISGKFTLPAGVTLVNETLQGSPQQILKFNPSQSTVMSTTVTAPSTTSWSTEAIFRTRSAGFTSPRRLLFGHGTVEGTHTVYGTGVANGNSLEIERLVNFSGGYNNALIPADSWIYFKFYNDLLWVYNITAGTWIANGEVIGAWDTLPSGNLNFWLGADPFNPATTRADADIAMLRFSSPANTATPTGAPAYTSEDVTADDRLFIVPGTVSPQLNVSTMTFEGSTTTLGAGAIAMDPTGTKVYQVRTSSLGIRSFTLTSPGNFLGGITQNADYSLPANGFPPSSIDGRTMGFKPDGLLLYQAANPTLRSITTWTVPQAWPAPVISATVTQELNFGQNPYPKGAFWFKPDGRTLYALGTSFDGTSQLLIGYAFTTPWVFSSNTGETTYNLSADWPNAPFNQFHSYVFNTAGTKLYLLHGQQYISEYSLSTAWNLTTMSYTGVQQNLGPLCGMTSFSTGNMVLDQSRGKLWLQGRGSDLVEKLYQFDFVSGTVALPFTIDYLVVGGGGGGGRNRGGGGGAGGMLTGTNITTFSKGITYTVAVGNGGGGGSSSSGSSGASSTFAAITANGGGGGGGIGQSGGFGGAGGGGSGAAFSSGAGGAGNTPSTTPSQGANGGNGFGANTNDASNGGGGGGGGENGVQGGTSFSSSFAGSGGAGTISSIRGTMTFYAGGGGAGAGQTGFNGGAGGDGGGGAGGNSGAAGSSAAANTGGGGGGGGQNANGAAGGSGVVIVRTSQSEVVATTSGLTTVTVIEGYRIYQFNSSGSIMFNSGVGGAAYPTINSADEAFKFTLDGSATVFLPADSSPNSWTPPGIGIDSTGYTSQAGNPFGTGGNYIASVDSPGRIVSLSSSAYATWHNANLAQAAWSFECHINPLTVPTQPIGLFYSGVSTMLLSKPSGQNWRISLGGATTSTASSGGVIGIVDLGPDFTAGLWQHLVIVWERTAPGIGTLRAYVNGALAGSTSVNLGFTLEFYTAASPADVNLAGRPFGGTVSFYIDNIRMIKGTPFPVAGFKAPRLPFTA
jgi:hypothetical protein